MSHGNWYVEMMREEARPHPRKVYSTEEMRESIQRAVEASEELKRLDGQIQEQIIHIQELLWDNEFEAFEIGEYSYACRKGRWRFVRTSDQTPVLSLKRDERCAFLSALVIPNQGES